MAQAPLHVMSMRPAAHPALRAWHPSMQARMFMGVLIASARNASFLSRIQDCAGPSATHICNTASHQVTHCVQTDVSGMGQYKGPLHCLSINQHHACWSVIQLSSSWLTQLTVCVHT
jgi:hypothetical protein